MLWWQGIGTVADPGSSEVNAPSIWSGGCEWDGDPPVKAYWQTTSAATARTGTPDVSVAIGGFQQRGVTRSLNWSLSRGDDWLRSILSPSSASVEIEGAVTFEVGDDVVIGVLSDTTDQHSAALWVGYVDTINENTDVTGRVTTSVSCLDVVSRFAQARAPVLIGDDAYGSFGEAMVSLFSRAGVAVTIDDPDRPPLDIGLVTDGSETLLSVINSAETSANAMLVITGSGHLQVYYRDPDNPLPTEYADLDTYPPVEWTRTRSQSDVLNEWLTDGTAETPTDEEVASQERYGLHSYDPDRQYLAVGHPYEWMRFGFWFLDPRWSVSGVPVPITDLGHPVLFMDPLEWFQLGGDLYHVLSVSHSVRPGNEWAVTLAGDTTPAVIAGA